MIKPYLHRVLLLLTLSASFVVPSVFAQDADVDGLSDSEEQILGTSPYGSDSDGDNVTDLAEVYPYQVVAGSYTFAQAKADAAARGGWLAVIDSPKKLYQIKRGLFASPLPNPLPNDYDPQVNLASGLWIGASDSSVAGRFQWGPSIANPLTSQNGPDVGSVSSGDLVPGSNQVTNVVNIGAFTVGRPLVASGVPSGTTITAVDTVARSLTLSNSVDAILSPRISQISVTNGGYGYSDPSLIRPTFTGGAVGLSSITVTPGSAGSGYISPPTVTLSGGGATTPGEAYATLNPSGQVDKITITSRGAGYTSEPTVTLSGGGVGFSSVQVTNPGSGYTSATPPTVTLSGGLGLSAINITGSGSGYTSDPIITLTGGIGLSSIGVTDGGLYTSNTAPTVSIDGGIGVESTVVTSSGSNYTSAPAVTLTGGGGSGATATAIISNKQVVGISITNPGTDYTSNPTVGFAGGIGLAAIQITAVGSGYTSAPNVVFTGGGGTGAAATASFRNGKMNGVTITNYGTGYASAPTITISGGGGTGATATATIGTPASGTAQIGTPAQATAIMSSGNNGWEVSEVVITSPGSGYTSPPTILVSGGSSLIDAEASSQIGAPGTAVATIDAINGGLVTGITITSPGTNYTNPPTVNFSASGATAPASALAVVSTAAIATATVDANGQVTGVTLAPGSNYTSAPVITLSGGGGSGATAVAVYAGTPAEATASLGNDPTLGFTVTDGRIQAIAVTNDGKKYYTTAPTVSITGGNGGGAVAGISLTPVANAQLQSISVVDAGSGYTSAPAITISGIGQITNIQVNTKGSNYTTTPTVIIGGGGGTGATATATVSGGSVTGITINSSGSGYTSVPLVTLSGGTITPATATATINIVAAVASIDGSGKITGFAVTNPGTGYVTAPTITLGSGQITKIQVNTKGINYKTAPTVSFVGGGGTGATATATVSGGFVTGITITNSGSGYTSEPSVILVGGGASTPATATATISKGATAVAFIRQLSAPIHSPVAGGYANWLPENVNALGKPEAVYLNAGSLFDWDTDLILGGTPRGYLLEMPATDPKGTDTDKDGLSDVDEIANQTDPLVKDTDGDLLWDGDEVNTYKTNPLLADTDGDGLFDKVEILDFKSSPFLIDTDGDLVSDSDEFNATKPDPTDSTKRVPDPTDPNDPSKYPNSGITELRSRHSLPVPVGNDQSVSIDESFAPFGHRPYRDKVGDDGSSVIIDRNGVLIWSNKSGGSLTIPNSVTAKTLHVSNTECLVYNNRYTSYNNQSEKTEIVIYRRSTTGGILSSKTVTIDGTVLDTASVTPTVDGYMLVSGRRSDDGSESTLITSGQYGDIVLKVDQWDLLDLSLHLIAWDGTPKWITGRRFSVPKNPGADFYDGEVLGYGNDGSLVINMTTSSDYLNEYPKIKNVDLSPDEFVSAKSSIWISAYPNKEDLKSLPTTIKTLAYVDNSRVIGQSTAGALLDYRNGTLSTAVMPPLIGETVLPFSTDSINGSSPYIYTIDTAGTSLRLYRADATIAALGNAVTLPFAIHPSADFVRNPRDGSLLVKGDGGNFIWVPTTTSPGALAPTGLDTPRTIPSSDQGKPLFVTVEECVVWLNSDELAINGSLPSARISHFRTNNGQLVTTNLTPPMAGKYVVMPNRLTPDPDSEGWYLTTYEKNAPASTYRRTYQLQAVGSTDRDNDGISDYEEMMVTFTDPGDPDTDGDGLLDGQEVRPYQFVTTALSWEAARLDAISKGGRLAVLDTQLKQDAFKAAMQFQKADGKYWIGGHDTTTEESFQWLDTKGEIKIPSKDGSGNSIPVPEISTPKNWDQYQPSNLNNADGLEVTSGSDYTYKWSMAQTSKLQGYAIEFAKSDPNEDDTDGDEVSDDYERANGTDPNDPSSRTVHELTLSDAETPTGGLFSKTSGSLVHGTNATLTAVPAMGYLFQAWTGDLSGPTLTKTLLMNGNKTVGAIFVRDLADDDSDGVSNYDELVTYGSNSTNKNSDGDGLSDGDEVNIHKTNPIKIDTDGDELNDDAEVNTHKTSPLFRDTDGDGLSDKQELVDGTYGFKSSPFVVDTDGDLVSDIQEVNAIPPTDPNDPSKYPNSNITPLSSLHALPVAASAPTSVAINESFAPYGHRPDRDKAGDDGSSVIIDRNGVLIWTNKQGVAVTVPGASLAKTLYVSNTECVVYNNRFATTYNSRAEKAEVVMHRRGATGPVTTSKKITIDGTVLDTCPVTPTTYGFTLVSGQTYEDGAESISVTLTIINTVTGPIERQETNRTDFWDMMSVDSKRITWDGEQQQLANTRFPVSNTTQNFDSVVVQGHGSDGSAVFSTDVAKDFLDRYDDADPGTFQPPVRSSFWVSLNLGQEKFDQLGEQFSSLAYLTNDRAVLQKYLGKDNLGTDKYELQDWRQDADSTVIIAKTIQLPAGERMLPISTYTIDGLPPYVYMIDTTRTSLRLYKADASLSAVGAVTLPAKVNTPVSFVRNPRDGSLLIQSDDRGLMWIPTTTAAGSQVVTGLGTPQILANSVEAKPLFVAATEAVAWLNGKATVINGSLPAAQILHYQFNTNGLVVASNLTPPMEGKYVVLPNTLTPDPDLEGWYVTTFEKNAPASTLMRTYQLQVAGSADRDQDGISDYGEMMVTFTDPGDPDTDGDGLLDGQEVRPYQIVSTALSWEDARLDAIAKGGRLAVLGGQGSEDSLDKQTALKAAMQFQKADGKYWIGGHDNTTEGIFEWLDAKGLIQIPSKDSSGNPIPVPEIGAPKNWDQNQPSNLNNADGMEVTSGSDYTFKWSMAQTSKLQGYVIEFAKTLPRNKDSDGDGLFDGAEVNTFRTNPMNKDSDGDGMMDGGKQFVQSASGTVSGTVDFTVFKGDYEGLVTDPITGISFKQKLSLGYGDEKEFTTTLFGLEVDYTEASNSSNPAYKGAFDANGMCTNPTSNVDGMYLEKMQLETQGGRCYIKGYFTNDEGDQFDFELRRRITNRTFVAKKLTFEATLNGSAYGPIGSSVATGDIDTKGKVTFKVYLADGTRNTYSGHTVDGNLIMLHSMSADPDGKNRRVLVGPLVQRPPTSGRAVDFDEFDGTVRLYGGQGAPGRLFADGYDQIRKLNGSVYNPPSPNSVPLTQFLGSFNTLYRWSDGKTGVGTWTSAALSYTCSPAESATVTFDRPTGLVTVDYIPGIDGEKRQGKAVVQRAGKTVKGFFVSESTTGALTLEANTAGVQPPAPAIVTPLIKDVTADGENYSVSIKATGPWAVVIPSEAASWVTATLVNASGAPAAPTLLDGNGNGTVAITVAPNPTDRDRSAVIRIAGCEHTISQKFVPRSIMPTSSPAPDKGTTYSVDVTAGGAWEVDLKGTSWVTVSPMSGNGKGTVSVTVAPNPSQRVTPRPPATITIAGVDHTITPENLPAIITPTSYVGNNAAVTYTVDVTAVGSWTVTKPTDATWVTVSPMSGNGNATITITLAANGTTAATHKNRATTIQIAGSAHYISQTWNK